jgi:6-phosphogluconolactonase (cycloisomerase 2 family)
MDIRTKLAAAGFAGVSAAGLLAFAAGPASASEPAQRSVHDHAVFVEANDPSGNTIAVYHRNEDGTLAAAGRYATGGLGGVLTGSVVDHLASQGAVTYDRDRRLLYAVNAGSNTVTVFAVHGDRLERLQVVGTGGTFPVSVTVHRGVVYVLNARAGGSIQGFLQVGRFLVRVPAWHRSLGLDPAATPEFVSTPGEIAFSPSGHQLVVTTKANGSQIDVFHVDALGGPSAAATVTPDPAGVPFAVTFDPTGRLDVAEAGPNAVATFVLHEDGTLTLVDRKPTGQAATCWIVGTGSHLYVDNAGSASVSQFDATSDGLVDRGRTATDPGTIDAAISGDYLYVQTGAAGVVDEFAIGADGGLTAIGSVTVAGAVGGEGIAAS